MFFVGFFTCILYFLFPAVAYCALPWDFLYSECSVGGDFQKSLRRIGTKATIRYTFADGHTEEVEVTEEFKREYEFLLVREQAPHWKEMKQKERAGLRCVKNLSLDKFSEDGYDLPVAGPDPLERLIQKEERREYCRKILSCLSEKQRQAYILFHLKGYKKVQIAAVLHIDERSVRRRLEWAQKRILKNFLKNSRF